MIDAISMAGGKTENGNDNILLIRREGEVANVYVIPLIEDDPRTYLYAVVSSNDIIYVPTSTIADVEMFMNRVNNIIAPILSIQRSVILWPDFIDAIRDNQNESSPPIIIGN